jgi:hypothetical protein
MPTGANPMIGSYSAKSSLVRFERKYIFLCFENAVGVVAENSEII